MRLSCTRRVRAYVHTYNCLHTYTRATLVRRLPFTLAALDAWLVGWLVARRAISARASAWGRRAACGTVSVCVQGEVRAGGGALCVVM